MNGLLGLAMNIETRPITPSSQNISGMFQGEPYSLNFAEVFAAVDDGDSEGNADGNIEHDLLLSENAERQIAMPEPVKPDLEIPVLSATQTETSEIVKESQIGLNVPELAKVTDEQPVVDNEARQNDAPVTKRVTGNDHSRPLQADNLSNDVKAAPVVSDEPELSVSPINGTPVQQRRVPAMDKTTTKDIQTALVAGVEKPAGPQQQSETVPLQDRNLAQTFTAPSAPTQHAVSPAPIFSSSIVAAPPVAAPMPAPIPAFPVLDIEAGNQWIARLSRDISQLSTEKPELNFQLKPENLGKLSVRITAGAAGDVVRLETESENVKALLIGSQGRLEQDIRLSGLKLARVDVTVQDHSGSQPGQHGSGSRENGPDTGRNSDAQPQEYRDHQNPLTQQGSDVLAPLGTAAASPHHGARYA